MDSSGGERSLESIGFREARFGAERIEVAVARLTPSLSHYAIVRCEHT